MIEEFKAKKAKEESKKTATAKEKAKAKTGKKMMMRMRTGTYNPGISTIIKEWCPRGYFYSKEKSYEIK